MTAGGGTTYPEVVRLLKEKVAQKGQRTVSRETGIALLSIQRYLKGQGEPTTATLQKLADYFGVSVAYLRGEENKHGFPLAEAIKYTLMKRTGPKPLIDLVDIYARRQGIITTKARIQELLPELEQELLAEREERNYSDFLDALFAPFDDVMNQYDVSYIPVLTRILEVFLESKTVKTIVEALISVSEERREEALAILQREGIIPPTAAPVK